MDQFIFKRPPEGYANRQIPQMADYIKQAAMYLSSRYNIPLEEALKEVPELLKKFNTKDPLARFRAKNTFEDKVDDAIPLSQMLESVLDNDVITVPSLTKYTHPKIRRSIHAEFLKNNIKLRNKYKHASFRYKQEGNMLLYMYNNTMQTNRKIYNNSLSGAYASKSTILCNPSAHYTLTSITRCMSSIGNALTESIVAGNKHLRDVKSVYNYIASIITVVDMRLVEKAVNRYKLYCPTAEEVHDSLYRSYKRYWEDSDVKADLILWLEKLTPIQRAAVMYVNSMWDLKTYNDKLIRDLIGRLALKVENITDDASIIKKAPEGIANLVHIICMDDIKGLNVDYDNLPSDLVRCRMASTCQNIMNVLGEYKGLIRTFLTTDIMPISIAYIKDMLRDSIVLSDTDSTCGAYGNWVEWYFGKLIFNTESYAISGAIMTINTQVMDHNIKLFVNNMNVDQGDVELLKMKNEFFWPIFTTTNVSKHYFASTWVKEGNVFKEPDLELKGVHLIASQANQDVVASIQDMINEINAKVLNNEHLSLTYYATKVADMERMILERIKSGDIKMFKLDKIKEAVSYKQDPNMSPYLHHMLWKEVFARKYGDPGEPMYGVIKIPTTLSTKKRMTTFIEGIEDVEIKTALSEFLVKHEKDNLGTFRPPLSIVGANGIPKELQGAINYQRIIIDNLNSAYLVLESLGLYRKSDMLLLDMGY